MLPIDGIIMFPPSHNLSYGVSGHYHSPCTGSSQYASSSCPSSSSSFFSYLGPGISCSVASMNVLKPGKYSSTSSMVLALLDMLYSFFGSGMHSNTLLYERFQHMYISIHIALVKVKEEGERVCYV